MKKYFLFIFFSFVASHLQSQDIVIKKNGDTLQVKIFVVTQQEIKYQEWNNPQGNIYSLDKSEIAFLSFQQDTVPASPGVKDTGAGKDICSLAKNDAKKYYRDYKSAGTGAFFCGTQAIVGLIPATIMAITPPKDANLGIYNSELFKNNSYYTCYKKEAYRVKKKKVAGNYCLGFGTAIVVLSGIGLIYLYNR